MIEVNLLFPVFVTDQLEAVSQFYQRVFGFQVAFFEPGFYLHLVSANGQLQLGFLMPEHASQPQFLHAKMVAEGMILSFETPDAALAFEQAKQLQLPIAMDLKLEPWGQHHFILQDPAGLYVDVVQH